MRGLAAAILLALSAGTAASQTLSVHDAFAWVSPGGRSAAAYFRLQNHCASGQVVIAASSSAARHAALHGHAVDEAGTARMLAMDTGIPVPAGTTVSFVPGGFHVMFMGLKGSPGIGDTINFVLTLDTGREIGIRAPVRPRGTRGTDN